MTHYPSSISTLVWYDLPIYLMHTLTTKFISEALIPGPHLISVVSQGPKSTEGREGAPQECPIRLDRFGVCCTPARSSGENLLIQPLIDAQIPATRTRPCTYAYGSSDMPSSTDFLCLWQGCASCEPPNPGSFYHTMNRFFCFCAVHRLCRTAADPQTTFATPHMSNSTTFSSRKWLSNTVWEYIVTESGIYRVQNRVRSSSLVF